MVGAVRDDREAPGFWRPFWPLTTALLVVMAIGRAGDVAGWLVDVARDRAHDDGWYQRRRKAQAAVVAALALGWVVTVLGACLTVPARRRRYLPAIVTIVTIIAFVAVRAVSLHQIDALLHRRHVAGLRVGTAIEYTTLAAAALAALAAPRRARLVDDDRYGADRATPAD